MGYSWTPSTMASARSEAGWQTRRANDRRREMERAAETERMALADKITMAVVDQIANAIIRPGPKPEERECYVMAQELRDHAPEIAQLVAAIIKVDDEEG